MTTARTWPNTAKEARDRSAEEAQAIVFQLAPLIEPDCLHRGRESAEDRPGTQ
jgi:hypothetical protein